MCSDQERSSTKFTLPNQIFTISKIHAGYVCVHWMLNI